MCYSCFTLSVYGSEIWGFENLKDVEMFHRRFFRILLCSYKFTPNCMLYGETNTTDISTKVNIRMINFWEKMECSERPKLSSILCKTMRKDFNNILSKPDDKMNTSKDNDIRHFKWCRKIKDTLDSMGLSSKWIYGHILDPSFKSIFKQRCYDVFIQKWNADLQKNSQCNVYKMFKDSPKIEKYMLKLENAHRFRILKFIMRVHKLPVTKNRFKFIENDPSTVCPLCDVNEVGNESHYLFKCKYFENERHELVPNSVVNKHDRCIAWKNLFKLDVHLLIDVSRFFKIIMNEFECLEDDLRNNDIILTTKETRGGRKIIPPVRLINCI